MFQEITYAIIPMFLRSLTPPLFLNTWILQTPAIAPVPLFMLIEFQHIKGFNGRDLLKHHFLVTDFNKSLRSKAFFTQQIPTVKGHRFVNQNDRREKLTFEFHGMVTRTPKL